MQMIFAALIGLLYVFAGYRMVRFTSKLESALLFTFLGLLACPHVDHWGLVAGLLCALAVVGYLLGNLYYYAYMALVGAVVGVVVMAIAACAMGGGIGWDSGVASALLGGMLAVRFQRPIVIFGTSLIGALCLMMAAHLPLMFTMPGPKELAWSSMVILAGLTLLGCLVQARRTAKPPAPRDP
jgi:hypothetical protein